MDIIGLIPSFGNLLYTVGAFIIALSIIVAVHEYGHYIVGKWTGIHAEVFSIGFGPVLFARTDRNGTVWQVAALPFGGYVKFLGDAGAVSDKASDEFEAMDEETKRHTMHGAPLWARVLTVAAGPVFNFVLSFFVFAAVVLFSGVATSPLAVGQVQNVPAEVQELRSGDQIIAVAGETSPAEYGDFFDFVKEVPNEQTLEYTVRRDGQEISVQAPFPYPALVMGLTPGFAAADAGVEIGDVITAIDGAPIAAFVQLQEAIKTSEGRTVTLTIWRDGETLELEMTPEVRDLPNADGGFDTRYLIGITGGLLFDPATETPGLGEAAGYGFSQTVYIIRASVSGLYHMAVGAIDSCNLRGPIGIAETSGAAASQGWATFIRFIAVLSTAVGLLNLFPIPVLDGGHLIFHAYEAVSGKPPSDRALRILMAVGLAILLTLMVFALTNDLFCP